MDLGLRLLSILLVATMLLMLLPDPIGTPDAMTYDPGVSMAKLNAVPRLGRLNIVHMWCVLGILNREHRQTPLLDGLMSWRRFLLAPEHM